MLKFLIGPLLAGAGYVAGSIYGASAEQIVHKSPADTYEGVEGALSHVRQSGTTFFEGGKPMPYEINIERTDGERLVVTLFFDGKQGAKADLAFTPLNAGNDTLITTKIEGENAVLREALAGTDKARLAYAPDWMLNLSAKPLLSQLAGQIEQGAAPSAFAPMSQGQAQAQWEAKLTDKERADLAAWRQYDATQPEVDPTPADERQ
jgi:hypothetical protein